MTTTEFHGKMKQHCESLDGECSQCCFLDYCYSQKRDITEDFLGKVMDRLSEDEEKRAGTSDSAIHNRHNVFYP